MSPGDVIEKVVSITNDWNELEEDMGEMAALEVACQQYSVDSAWYFDQYGKYEKEVNKHLAKK